MPIIEPAAADVPLSQGDVLADVRLFLTKDFGPDHAGDPLVAASRLCLVLSRPCVAAHKANILVAAIERYPDSVPRSIETFEDVRAFLTELRDGNEAPDLFYLGQLPGLEGRHAARLDSVHSIQQPREEAARKHLLARKRLGRLNIEFARDLHLRLFRAFASLGFDDHGWLATSDLRWLAAKGAEGVSAATAKLRGAEAALSSAQAQGFRNPSEQQQLERAVTAARQGLAILEEALAPYQAELSRRDAPAG